MPSNQIAYQTHKDIDLVKIVTGYVKLQGNHKVLKGACPFHQDSQNSLMVSIEKNIFKCFGCGQEGGPIEFIMAIEGKSRAEATDILSKL
jgi:DNA primase